jgi:hypothetical protein
MTLWDNFSDELKEITLSERLNPANIFKFHNNQTNPPKIKFIALIARQNIDDNDRFAYLFIGEIGGNRDSDHFNVINTNKAI